MSSEASPASPLGATPSGLPAQTPRPPREPDPVRLTVNYRETTSPVWDISQERLVLETLLHQRLQFFLVFFSIVVGGSLNAKLQLHMVIVFIFGSALSWLLALYVFRAQLRLSTALSIIREDETHPHSVVRKMTNRRSLFSFIIISHYITILCCTALSAGAILSLCGWLTVANTVINP